MPVSKLRQHHCRTEQIACNASRACPSANIRVSSFESAWARPSARLLAMRAKPSDARRAHLSRMPCNTFDLRLHDALRRSCASRKLNANRCGGKAQLSRNLPHFMRAPTKRCRRIRLVLASNTAFIVPFLRIWALSDKPASCWALEGCSDHSYVGSKCGTTIEAFHSAFGPMIAPVRASNVSTVCREPVRAGPCYASQASTHGLSEKTRHQPCPSSRAMRSSKSDVSMIRAINIRMLASFDRFGRVTFSAPVQGGKASPEFRVERLPRRVVQLHPNPQGGAGAYR